MNYVRSADIIKMSKIKEKTITFDFQISFSLSPNFMVVSLFTIINYSHF